MSDQINSIARLIGNSYAQVQHGIDRAIEWGFSKMEEQAKAAPKKKKKVSGVERAGRGVLGFLGAAGEAYFRTYSNLKKKK